MKKITALVPIKEHSERVPGKNFRGFNGKPLFYWILSELAKVEQIDNIYVNTDSIRIAELIKEHFPKKVEIINRPSSLCGDEVSMNLIIAHDIGIIDSEHYIQTHTTNPLLIKDTIEKAIEVYFKNLSNYDSVFSVTRIQSRCFTHDGIGINHNPNELIPTQQLSPVYAENSNFYIFSKKSFEQKQKRIGRSPYMYEMNPYEAVDIDEEVDFTFAEILHKQTGGRL